MSSALFWYITQRVVLIPYWSFEVSEQPMGHIFKLQESWEFLTLEYGNNKLSRNVSKESSLYTAAYPRRAQKAHLR